MMYHSDPTANRAMGSVNQEWEQKLCLAYRFRTDPQMAKKLKEPEKVFSGIYRRLLEDPITELQLAVLEIKARKEKKQMGINPRKRSFISS